MTLLALIACENGPIGNRNLASYDVTLNVVVPSNQAPFDGLDRLVLRLDHAAGEPEEYELSSTTGSPQVEGLGDLEDTRITLAGYIGDELVTYGTSQPQTAHDEDIEETVLVTRVGSAGWLGSLDKPNALSAVAPDGNGSFYIFGGEQRSYTAGGGTQGNPSGSIWRLDVAPPEADLAFVEIGSMPTFEADNADTDPAHIGHTATLLTGSADDAGLVLLAGGHTHDLELRGVSASAFLYDPATGEVVETENSMREARTQHVAVELQTGDVLFAGGWGASDRENGLDPTEDLVLYQRNDRKFQKLGAQESFGPGLSAASLGSKGALVCGGVQLPGGGSFHTLSTCHLVQGDTVDDDAVELGLSRAFHQMVPLDDGRVMVIGGVSSDDDVEFNTTLLPALSDANIYDANTGLWSDAGDMNMGRAGFVATTLPDGRVLVVGGNSAMGLYYHEDADPLACAEVWSEADGWEVLDGCSAGSSTGSLPSQTWWPALASDEVYGVLVVGGLHSDATPSEGVTYFAASPEM